MFGQVGMLEGGNHCELVRILKLCDFVPPSERIPNIEPKLQAIQNTTKISEKKAGHPGT